MKKEIYLGLYSDNHNYYSHGDNPLHFSWLCRESVCQILGEIPTMIKITVTDRNPKKKGWHKFCFVRNNYVKFSGYKPSNSYDQDYQGNKYVLPPLVNWLRNNFGDENLIGKPLFFKIEKYPKTEYVIFDDYFFFKIEKIY